MQPHRSIRDLLAVDTHRALGDLAPGLRAAGGQPRGRLSAAIKPTLLAGRRREASAAGRWAAACCEKRATNSAWARLRRRRVVEARDDLARQLELDVAGIAAVVHLALAAPAISRQRPKAQQLEVAPHQLIRDRHELAEHLLGRIVDGDERTPTKTEHYVAKGRR